MDTRLHITSNTFQDNSYFKFDIQRQMYNNIINIPNTGNIGIIMSFSQQIENRVYTLLLYQKKKLFSYLL